MTTTNLILVRHGQTEFNKHSRLQGLTDSPLTEAGVKAAEKVGHGLVDVPIVKAYTSDSDRAVATAELILKAAHEDIPLIKESFLREYHFGDLEGRKFDQIFMDVVRRYGLKNARSFWDGPTFLRKVINGFHDLDATKQAESYDEITQRIQKGLAQILADPDVQGKNILLVSHSLLLSTLVYQIAPEQIPKTLLKNASVSILGATDGKLELKALNLLDFKDIQKYL